ncbi:MAG: hypothetical protein KAS12_04960 [Candidatus Aenigmarchaeota archaeon]|nr:hypothetical protein [Candidatus Aenigmarchaeota archaeon]
MEEEKKEIDQQKIPQLNKHRRFDQRSLVIVILMMVLIASLILGISGKLYFVSKSKVQQITNQAIDFIKSQILQPGTEINLVDQKFNKQLGTYEFKMKLGEEEFISYISRNGQFLFPQGISMEQVEVPVSVPVVEIPKQEKADVELFVMSFCSFGNQAELLMYDVQELLNKVANITPRYVIYGNYEGGSADYCLADGKYCSMHGINELNQNVRELCLWEKHPDQYWEFIKQIDEQCTLSNIEQCWLTEANKMKIDTVEISTCQINEAVELLEEQVLLNNKYGVQGSPDLVINGVHYQGERTAEGYKQAICSGFNQPPVECQQTLSDTNASVGNCG